jgi:NAD(P)-dependent dehydrogenase (short-subunit alcohol dehydrogenase family)
VRTASDVVEGLDLTGRTAVITGAASGLGRESARALAAAGAHVVLAGRNLSALTATRDALGGRASIVELDLTSLASIRAAAAAIEAPRIDILMNNAGVMFTPFGRTTDGFETQFGTNHLGHFELTRLLAPRLEGARVVVLSSDGHRLGDVDLDDPDWRHREYDKFAAYGAAKTANVLHTVELDRRLRERGTRAYAVHPGMVATNLARHMSRDDVTAITERAAAHAVEILTPQQGAATQVWAAVGPDLDGRGGVYLADCEIRSDVAPYAVDAERAARLWDISEELCDGG